MATAWRQSYAVGQRDCSEVLRKSEKLQDMEFYFVVPFWRGAAFWDLLSTMPFCFVFDYDLVKKSALADFYIMGLYIRT